MCVCVCEGEGERERGLKPSLIGFCCNTQKSINHAQIWYVSERKHSTLGLTLYRVYFRGACICEGNPNTWGHAGAMHFARGLLPPPPELAGVMVCIQYAPKKPSRAWSVSHLTV